MSRSVSRRSFFLAAGTGVAGLAAGYATGSSLGTPTPTVDPIASAVDVGFCSDMSSHHLQAIAMCQRVLGRDTGDAVQAAATEVLTTQAIEVGTMRAWLADWGQSTAPPETVMAWMGSNLGNGMPADSMPGYASDDDMRALSMAEGHERGRLWIELMRAHHVGGVHMAEAAIEMTATEKVRRLATVQVQVQTFEIAQYDRLLVTDYA